MADVVCFIDHEYLNEACRCELEERPNYKVLKEACSSFGRLVMMRTYMKYRKGTERFLQFLSWQAIQYEILPSKDCDAFLGSDIIETLHESPNVTTFVLISGDGDFLRVLQKLRAKGKQVIVIALSSSLSKSLKRVADHIILYETIHKSIHEKFGSDQASFSSIFNLKIEEVREDAI